MLQGAQSLSNDSVEMMTQMSAEGGIRPAAPGTAPVEAVLR